MQNKKYKKMLNVGLFLLAIFLSLVSQLHAVNICPIDKNPTEITIEHSRHPINIPLGITDNSIDVTVQLNVIDRKTGTKIPLANKELLFELTIGSKFITKDSTGSFVLSDVSSPFPVNTSENGTVHFTIFTQPPLLENSTDPRKISYSITASFTPKPREPLMGSVKTERYIPGVFPIISMTACAPLIIIFGLLIAAMFAAGKNPFGLFDFSRVAFKAPMIQRKQLTTRAKTGLTQVLTKTTTGVLKSIADRTVKKGYQKQIANLEKKAEELEKAGKTKEAGRVRMEAASLLPKAGVPIGKVTQSPEDLKRIKQTQEKIAAIQGTKEIKPGLKSIKTLGYSKEEYAYIKSQYNLALPQKESGWTIINRFLNYLGGYGYNPWLYASGRSAAMTAMANLPRKEMYSKQEQEDIKKKIEETYGVKLTDKDIDKYGLTESGKQKIAKNNLNDRLMRIEVGLTKKILDEIERLNEQGKEESERLRAQGKIREADKKLQETMREVDKKTKELGNVSEIAMKETIKFIRNDGSIDLDKNVLMGKIDIPAYYKNYGIKEAENKILSVAPILENSGISSQELIKAIKEKDADKLKEIFNNAKDDPNKFILLNYAIKEALVGHGIAYLNSIELKDEKGNVLPNDKKLEKILNSDLNTKDNHIIIAKAVVANTIDEKIANKSEKSLLDMISIVEGKPVKKEDLTTDKLLNTVLTGENILKERIENKKKEIDDFKIANEKLTRGEPGYDTYETKLENKKNELWKLERDLDKFKEGTREIVNNIEMIKITSEMNKYSVEKKIEDIGSMNPVAFKNTDNIFGTVGIDHAKGSGDEIVDGANKFGKGVDALTKQVNELANKVPELPGIPYKIDEVDYKIHELVTPKEGKEWSIPSPENVPGLIDWSVKNILNAENINKINESNPAQILNSMIEKIDNTKKFIEEKENRPLSDDEKWRYSGYWKRLDEMRNTIFEMKEEIDSPIKKFNKEREENIYTEIVADTPLHKFSVVTGKTEMKLDPLSIAKQIDNVEREDIYNKQGLKYYYMQKQGLPIDEELKKKKEQEDEDWKKKWWYKETAKVSEITLEEGRTPYGIDVSSSNTGNNKKGSTK